MTLARYEPPDTGQRSSECPTSWTGHTQILDGGDAGITAIGYPTVVKATGRIGSPLDAWYLWATPHDSSVGPYLFTASTPAGPWTIRNSGNPVTITIPTGYTDISPTFVLWDPNNSLLKMWTTSRRTSPNRQDTFLYHSTNGTGWTIQNSGNPVLQAPGDNTGPADGYESAYMTVVRDGDRFTGLYQGINKTSPDDVAHACLAHSGGLAFSRVSFLASPWLNAAWANDSGDDIDNCGSFRPVALKLTSGIYGYHAYRVNGSTTADGRVRRLQGTGGFSTAFDDGLGLGADGSFDEAKRVVSDFVYDDGKFWCFYTAATDIADNSTESIGVASCTFAQSGFDTTWGKG